jgi:plastocyanin
MRNHDQRSTMIRLTALAAAAATALALAASTAAAPVKLVGTVGPGFTITLKKGSAKVTKLKAGKYTFVIHDKSNIHNFHLKGPVSKMLTSVSYVGTKTVTVTLKAGKYTYVCDPHASTMRGSFTVS